MRARSSGRLAAGLALAGILPAEPAGAAVRQCQPVIVTAAKHPRSEAEARREALSQWVAAARQHGEGFTRWQLADRRSIVCVRSAADGHACRVIGAPCTVSQAPVRPLPAPKKGVDA